MLGVSRPMRGYTLLELLVTLAIVAILATLAAPAFTSLIETQRVRSASNTLVNSLNLARSEAVTRNATIKLEKSAAGWSAGWTVSIYGTATVLRSENGVNGISITGSANSVNYTPDGRSNATVEFDVAPDSGDVDRSRCVSVSLSGKPRVQEGEC